MKKLEIKNPDGSIYWTEYFNNQEQAEKWLSDEMTRPYWNKDFTYSIMDHGQPEKTAEEIAAERSVLEQKIKDRADRLNSIANTNIDAIATFAALKPFLKLVQAHIKEGL